MTRSWLENPQSGWSDEPEVDKATVRRAYERAQADAQRALENGDAERLEDAQDWMRELERDHGATPEGIEGEG